MLVYSKHSQTVQIVPLRNIAYDGGRPLGVPTSSIYFRMADGRGFPLLSALQGGRGYMKLEGENNPALLGDVSMKISIRLHVRNLRHSSGFCLLTGSPVRRNHVLYKTGYSPPIHRRRRTHLNGEASLQNRTRDGNLHGTPVLVSNCEGTTHLDVSCRERPNDVACHFYTKAARSAFLNSYYGDSVDPPWALGSRNS